MTTALKKLVTEGSVPKEKTVQSLLQKAFGMMGMLHQGNVLGPHRRDDRNYIYRFLEGVESDVDYAREVWGDDVADSFEAVIKAYKPKIEEFRSHLTKLEAVVGDLDDLEQTGMLAELSKKLTRAQASIEIEVLRQQGKF